MKRIASLLLVFVLVAGILAVVPFSANAISPTTSGTVANRIDQLLQLYPNGSYFSQNGYACNNCGGGCSNCNIVNVMRNRYGNYDFSWTAYSCVAFSRFAFWYIFSIAINNDAYNGVAPAGTTRIGPGDMIIGDIAVWRDGANWGHWAIYLGNGRYYHSNTSTTNIVSYNTASGKTRNPDWAFRANNYNEKNVPPIPPGVGSRTVSGDFNGDGKDDYATLYDMGNGRAAWHVFLSTGSGFSEEIWWQQNTPGWYHAANVSGRVVAGDFNGDGLCDVAVLYDYGITDAEGQKSQWHVFLSTGSSFQGWQNWRTQTHYPLDNMTDRVVAGDFNGDGKDDIAAIYYYNWNGLNEVRTHVYLSNGKQFTMETWSTNIQYDGDKIRGRVVAGDFNGDGKDDLCAIYDYGGGNMKHHVWLSTGSKFNGWSSWKDSTQTNASAMTGRVVAGDFNGDGKDDIATMYDYGNGTSRMLVYTSTGSSFSGWGNWWEQMREGWYDARSVTGRMVAGDFNGDGVDDVARMFDYSGDSQLHVFFSNKTKFTDNWQNKITGYNAKRTTGMTGFTDNYTAGFSFKHAHTYKKVVTAPTCTAQGFTTHTCTKGDHSYRDNTTAALGHSWNAWAVTKAATETAEGTETRTCKHNATHKETRAIPKLAHVHSWSNWTSTKAPTCTATGTETRTCKNNSAHKETRTVKAKGHSWSAWKTTKAATVSATGTQERTCSACKIKETKKLPKLAATPTANQKAGTYTGSVKVKLTSTVPDAKIYYTTDGKNPSTKSKSVTSGKTVTISKTATLKFMVVAKGYGNSTVVSRKYTIKTTAPNTKAAPANKAVKKNSNITLTAPKGVTLYYTVNGDNPTTKTTTKIASEKTKAIKISKKTTIKVIAVKSGCLASTVVTRTYTLK